MYAMYPKSQTSPLGDRPPLSLDQTLRFSIHSIHTYISYIINYSLICTLIGFSFSNLSFD